MNTEIDRILFWHQPVWEQFCHMGENLPHAILLYGLEGTGKTVFAEYLAKSFLCEDRLPDGHACLKCVSCNWVDQKTHPDYRRVLPAALDFSAKTENAAQSDDAKEKSTSKTGGAPSRWIGIDQIRDLDDYIGLSTSRGGYRFICVWPAEALRTESANALLKMLEEPPSSKTIFILVTSQIDRLLPTILSRCRKFAMPQPAFSQAVTWLKDQGVSDAEIWLSEQGGAPVRALEKARTDSRDELDAFLAALMSPDIETALQTAEKLRKSSASDIVSWLQRWLYDLFSFRMTGRMRYFLRWEKQIAKQAFEVNLNELLRLIKKTAERKRVSEHPLVLRLLIEDILIDYAKLFA